MHPRTALRPVCVIVMAGFLAACAKDGSRVTRPSTLPQVAVGSIGAGLPDLIVDEARLAGSWEIRRLRLRPGSCEIQEGCVVTSGRRTLLRFDTATPNIGAGDVVLGDPSQSPNFAWSPCHNHYHFSGYALYELVTLDGTLVLAGRKQAFCLLDWEPYLPDAGPSNGYDCGFQGISAGWQDVYDRRLPCQFLDVTGVAPGEYLLRVTVNPDAIILESDAGNNVAEVTITIPKHFG